jgi:hypothetical protein
LPLVLFEPEPGISDAEACKLIMQAPKDGGGGGGGGDGDDGWDERSTGAGEARSFGGRGGGGGGGGGPDSFTAQLMNFEGGADAHARSPIRADAKTLLSLKRDEVFAVRHPAPGRRATFFRNMTPEMPLLLCSCCGE